MTVLWSENFANIYLLPHSGVAATICEVWLLAIDEAVFRILDMSLTVLLLVAVFMVCS